MHHYGEDSTEVIASETKYEIIFTNKATRQKITMHIPRVGILEDPSKGLHIDDIRKVADSIAHLIRQELV